jgi:hypothetical protein
MAEWHPTIDRLRDTAVRFTRLLGSVVLAFFLLLGLPLLPLSVILCVFNGSHVGGGVSQQWAQAVTWCHRLGTLPAVLDPSPTAPSTSDSGSIAA